MKLKYYLRGLGIGMVVTVLILGLAPGKSGDSAMTDAQIIARAKELGMVERKVLSDTVQPEDGKTGETPDGNNVMSGSLEQKDTPDSDEPEMEDEENDVSRVDGEPEVLDESTEPHTQAIEDTEDGGEAQTPEEQQAAAQPEEPSAEDGDGQKEGVSDSGTETVRVEIVRGDSSNTVCRKLKEAGLVADETAYNSYLCENGYDKSILANTYEIPVGMSESEIAALITGH